jgi:polysaccharide deacetylase 2 family uncharacterized protein YibQ
MVRLAWAVAGGVVLALAVGVVVLDHRQAARGAPSLFGIPWSRDTARDPAAPARPTRATAPGGHRPGAPAAAVGRIAIIIDGLGSRADVFERVLAVGRPLTIAVLPELPLSRRIIRDASRAGLEVLLQVPLEPHRVPHRDPGPGALLVSMPPAEITRRVRQLLAGSPGVVGVATHMGSRFTEDATRMQALLEAVREQKLLFVDSLSTHRSAGYDLARTMGMRAARRQVLLDPDEGEATGRARLVEAERWAERRGTVVAIAHGRLTTVRLLEEAVRRWDALGLRLVPVSELAS